MRILGLDIGTKRIGLALSDELMLTAQGIETLRRNELTGDIDRIKDIINKNGVTEVVAGLPLNMDGTYSAKTKEVAAFIDALKRSVDVPVRTQDERLTTVQAERSMLEADLSRAKRRRLADKVAAQLILQGYLDSLKRGKTDV